MRGLLYGSEIRSMHDSDKTSCKLGSGMVTQCHLSLDKHDGQLILLHAVPRTHSTHVVMDSPLVSNGCTQYWNLKYSRTFENL